MWCCDDDRGLIGIQYESRTVTVLISHVGIEVDQLNKALEDPRVIEAAVALKAKHEGEWRNDVGVVVVVGVAVLY